MSTDLRRIGERARKEPGVIFTTLHHHVTDVDNLRACYDALPEDRAVGVDGVTKAEYGRDLAYSTPESRGKPQGSLGKAKANGVSTQAEAAELYSETGQ